MNYCNVWSVCLTIISTRTHVLLFVEIVPALVTKCNSFLCRGDSPHDRYFKHPGITAATHMFCSTDDFQTWNHLINYYCWFDDIYNNSSFNRAAQSIQTPRLWEITLKSYSITLQQLFAFQTVPAHSYDKCAFTS